MYTYIHTYIQRNHGKKHIIMLKTPKKTSICIVPWPMIMVAKRSVKMSAHIDEEESEEEEEELLILLLLGEKEEEEEEGKEGEEEDE